LSIIRGLYSQVVPSWDEKKLILGLNVGIYFDVYQLSIRFKTT